MKWYDVAGWGLLVVAVVFFIMFSVAAVWTSTMAGGKEVDDEEGAREHDD